MFTFRQLWIFETIFSPFFSVNFVDFGKEVVRFLLCSATKLTKVIPQYCIAHPYCVRFLALLAHAHSVRTLTTRQFLYETKLAREIKGHFLLNEHGDLSFFLHNFDEIIIFFELNEF